MEAFQVTHNYMSESDWSVSLCWELAPKSRKFVLVGGPLSIMNIHEGVMSQASHEYSQVNSQCRVSIGTVLGSQIFLPECH